MVKFQDLPPKVLHRILDLAIFPKGHNYPYPSEFNPDEGSIIPRLSPIHAQTLRSEDPCFARAIPYLRRTGLWIKSQDSLGILYKTLRQFEYDVCKCSQFYRDTFLLRTDLRKGIFPYIHLSFANIYLLEIALPKKVDMVIAICLGQLLTSLVEVNLRVEARDNWNAFTNLMSFWPANGGVKCPIQKLRFKDLIVYEKWEDMDTEKEPYDTVSTILSGFLQCFDQFL